MSLADYIRAIPKAELHIHLEGSVQPATLLDLAQQHGVELPATTVEELREWYTFRNFDHFIEIYMVICDCLRTADDFTRITYEYGRSMAENNIRYAEVTFTPHTHLGSAHNTGVNALTWDSLLAAINAGYQQAKQEWGVEMRWIPDIARCFPDTAAPVVEWLTAPNSQPGGVVAIGLGGPEVGFPPELFEDTFQQAIGAGLHSNPHAGETVGPESVWGAIRALKAERLGHGVRAIEDPALLDYILEHQIPLEVNPTSNICLGVYPSYETHTLRQWVEAGAVVTINTDDPSLFNTTLNAEYLRAITDCGLSVGQVETAALNAIKSSYLPAHEKTAMLNSFQDDYARLRSQFGINGDEVV